MMMKRLMASVVVTSLSLIGLAACSVPDQSSDNPNNNNPSVIPGENDTIRENQLESDARARRQREDLYGNEDSEADIVADNELTQTVRNKLDTQLPGNKLEVSSEDGAVTISGEATSKNEMQRIKSIVNNVEGVRSVNIQARIVSQNSLN